MNRHFGYFLSAGCALVASLAACAQNAGELKVFTAIEVEFLTEPGKAYTLQGSTNLTDWVNIGEPVLGHGRMVNQFFSAKAGGEVSFANYRLLTDAGPTNGWAPWSFAGVQVQFDDQAGHDLFTFTDATSGVEASEDDNDPFTYEFSRLGENEARAALTYSDKKQDVLTFTFTSATQGTWVREEFRKGIIKDRDVGVFSIVDGGSVITNPPPTGGGETNVIPVVPPESLAGLSYLFQRGETPDRLDFLSPTNGVSREDNVRSDDDNPDKPFTYAYELTSTNAASLTVRFDASRTFEYDLTFTQGAQGLFVRREIRDGKLKATKSGSFSPTTGIGGPAVPAPSTNDRGGASGDDAGKPDDNGATGNDDTGPDDKGATGSDDTIADDKGSSGSDDAAPDDNGTTPDDGTKPDDNGIGGSGKPDDHGTNPGTGGNTTPPTGTALVTPAGFTFTMIQGATPDRLVFNDATTGIERGDSSESSFTYTYTMTAAGAATLKVQFKADRWDEYDLSFTGDAGGTFVRREFKRGLLNDTDAGTFAAAAN